MKNPKLKALLIILQIIIAVILSPSDSVPSEVPLFNQTYIRSTGKPITEEVTIVVPVAAENYRVVITNGNENGTNRCSSAFADIEEVPMDEVVDIADSDINGTSIIVPSDLNQNVYIIEKYLMLYPVNIFKLTLGSKPGCFLNIKMIGIDWTPPQITITNPSNGSILGTTTTPVSGMINDPHASVTINGVEAQKSGGSFQSTIPLNYGQNDILAVAGDFYNNSSTHQISVISDTNLPVITVDPTPEYVSGNTIELTGRIEDLTATSVSVQGQNVSIPAGGGIFTFTANLTEGLNTIIVSAEDSANNTSVASRIITSDTNPPAITLDPTPQYISSHALVLTGSINDLTATTVSIQGQSVSVPAGGGTFSFNVNLTEGLNTLSVSAQDNAGNTSEASRTITSDTIAPAVDITAPIDGAFIVVNTTAVSGTVTDATPPTVTVNGVNANVTGENFNVVSLSLVEGANTIMATATDAAGNMGTDEVTVIADTNPPVITIDPTPEYISSHTILLTGNVSDLTATTVGIQGQSMSVPAGGGTFSFTVNLTEGLNTLTVSAQDRAGNTSETSRTITSDTIAPVVQIISPTSGVFIAVNVTAVTGTITDATPVTVSVNGIVASISGNTFTITSLSLAEGTTTIIATATDAAGNAGTDEVTIVSDMNPPVITIDPTPEYISNHTLVLTGSVSDLTASTVSIQGLSISVPAGGGTFSFNVNLTEGLNTLTVSAQDSAGNTSEASRTITSDTIAPVVQITSPITGVFISANASAVSGTVNDATLSTVNVNGVDATVTGDSFSVVSIALTEGSNMIIATATDAAGNTGTDQITVISDTTPPIVTIDTPADGLKTNTDAQTVTGTVTDASPVNTLMLNGAAISSTGGSYEALHNLVEGSNNIRVEAIDAAGNNGAASITVTLDTIPPDAPLIDPLPDVTNAVNITVTGSAEAGSMVKIAGAGGTTADGSGRFSMSVSLTLDAVNTFSATATDDVGNESAATVFFIRQDSIAPEVTGFTLLADPKLTLNMPVSITFSETLDASTVNVSNITLQSPLGNVSGSVSYSGTEAIFTPDAELAANQVFTLTVNTGIKDRAGNALASVFTGTFETLRGPAFILGEVYDDTLGLPVEGAGAGILKIGGDVPDPAIITFTDVMGRFSLEYEGAIGDALIETHKDGFTKALRLAHIEPNKSVEIFDARLTPVETYSVQAAAGGTLAAGDTTLTIPAAALAHDLDISIAELSQQGMGYRLPIGWSPLYGFDISPWNETLNTPAILSIKNKWSFTSASQFTVARFDSEMLIWIAGSASISGDYINVEVSTLGQYYLIIPDTLPTPPPSPQAAGETILPSMNALPDGGTATVEVNPKFVLSRADAQGMTVVVVTTQNVIPSGTPIEARITEKYNLSGGDVVTTEPFIQDITLYGWPDDENHNTLSADFPTTPSKYYPFGRLYYGSVNIDIALSDYGEGPVENIMGDKGGTVSGPGGTGIIVPPSSLTGDTVFSMESLSESEVPAAGPSDLAFLGAVILKMQGGTFKPGAYPQFTLPISMTEGMEVILTKVVTIDGKSALSAVATGIVSNGKVTINRCLAAQCISNGRYSFYKPSRTIGFISGDVSKSGVPASGVIMSVDNLPFKTVTDNSGRFDLVGLSGYYIISASEPGTGLIASAQGTISGGENTVLHLDLAPSKPRVSAVTPYDKETAVGPDRKIEVTFTVPVDPYTVDNNSFVVLEELPGIKHELVPVDGRISIVSDNSKAVFTPEFELEPNTIYHIKLSGQIMDKFGVGLAPFESVFTTAEVLGSEALEPGELRAGLPDENGYITVRGGPGMAAPGSAVRIINMSAQSIVLTVSAEDDGSFEGMIQATIADEIVVEVKDLLNNITTLSTGPFTDGQGSTAVGPKGGTIDGPGGIEAYIPEGAFNTAVIVKISMLPESALQDVTIDPALRNAGVFQIDTGGVRANKELKVSAPAPEWMTAEHQVLVTRVLNIRGFDELTLACPAVTEDGKMFSTSPPFEGLYESGTYGFTTWIDPATGVGFAMVETWSYYGVGYVMGDYGFNFAAPEHTKKTFPITVPVNRPYDVKLSSLAGEPLVTVSIQGPPARGVFKEGIVKLSDDDVPPTVISSSISDGSSDIDPSEGYIEIAIDEAVDPSTVNRSTVTVRDSNGNIVEGDVYVAADGQTIVFIPRYGYKYGETYTITINGVKDHGGNLITGYQTTFSTFKPEILSTIPVPFAMAIDKYKDKDYIVVKGDDALVGLTVFSSINMINVSDPKKPRLAGKTNLYGYMYDIKMTDDGLAVAVGGKFNKDSYLHVIDVNDPSSPNYIESVYLSWSTKYGAPPANVPYMAGSSNEVAVLGGSAYVATQGIGVQAVDIAAVTPPHEDAQANAIGGTKMDSSYTAIAKVRNNILAVKRDGLSVLGPSLAEVGQITGFTSPYAVTGVEAFPIDLDNDGNIGIFEDQDGDPMTSAQESFDLALMSTPEGIVIINVTNPQSPQKMDMIPIPAGKIAVDRWRRLAYTNQLSIISLKDIRPLSDPADYGVKRDSDKDGIDDRLLFTLPEASGFDLVLSDEGAFAYIADYTEGLVKVVKLGLGVQIVNESNENVDEVKFGDGGRTEVIYHSKLMSVDRNLCSKNIITGKIMVTDKDGNQITSSGSDYYPTEYDLDFQWSGDKCQIKVNDNGVMKEKFIVSNLARTALNERNTDLSNKSVLFGGVEESWINVEVKRVDRDAPATDKVRREPLGVVVIGIDGLRQDVLYSSSEASYNDPAGCGGSCFVQPTELKGLCDILGGKFEDGWFSDSCNTTGWENKHIKLPNVTSIFPSITLASWASIFTGKMPGERDATGNLVGTGILGNEFFARDLYNKPPVPGMAGLPSGMITLSDGAFKNSSASFLFNNLLPAHEQAPTTREKLQLSSPNQVLNRDAETVYEWINKQTSLNNVYSVSNSESCKDGTSECRSAVFFNHYARGADWWGSQSLGWLENVPFSWVDYFAEGISPVTVSENLDSKPREEFINFTDSYFGDQNKDKKFPLLTTVYFGGLDHYAHDVGMDKASDDYVGYKDYFQKKTDSEIKKVIDKLKDLNEFDNKIFIITADHGHTAMPTDIFYKSTLTTPDPIVPSFTYETEVLLPADTSCKLNLDFRDTEDSNETNHARESERNNNNLHIWELGEVFKAVGKFTRGAFSYRILAPESIATLYSEEAYGARGSLPDANVIAALNGPMAHVYVTDQADIGRVAEIFKLTMQGEFIAEAVNRFNLTEKGYKDLRSVVGRLRTSVDKILVRKNGNYCLFDGISDDGSARCASGDTFSTTEYVNAWTRINGMNHPDRSGDIVLLMKDATLGTTLDRYTTGVACKSWHGSLNTSDSYVPFILSYPGGNKTEMEKILQKDTLCKTDYSNCKGNWKLTDIIKEIIQEQFK